MQARIIRTSTHTAIRYEYDSSTVDGIYHHYSSRLRRPSGPLKYRTYAPDRICGQTNKYMQSVNRGLKCSTSRMTADSS